MRLVVLKFLLWLLSSMISVHAMHDHENPKMNNLQYMKSCVLCCMITCNSIDVPGRILLESLDKQKEQPLHKHTSKNSTRCCTIPLRPQYPLLTCSIKQVILDAICYPCSCVDENA